MFRWFRNFGGILRKQRGAAKNERGEEQRSQGGKCGSSGTGKSVTSSSYGSRASSNASKSSGTATRSTKSTGTRTTRSTRSSAARSTRRSRKSRRSRRLRKRHVTGTGKSVTSSSYGASSNTTTSSGTAGRSTRSTGSSVPISTRSRTTGRSRKSTGSSSQAAKSTRSIRSSSQAPTSSISTGSSSQAPTSSGSSSQAPTTTRSSSLEPTSTRSGRSAARSIACRRRQSPSPNPPQRKERGRDRTQRNNVNAQGTVLSPTNRSSRLDRSRSKSHEKTFMDRMNMNHEVWNEKIPKGTHVIYTDGSYLKWEGKSGIGIFMGPDHPLNRSQKIRGAIQDSQYAEFLAVRTGLENLRSWEGYHENDPVIVRTDNRNVIVALKNRDFSQFSGIAKDILDLCKDFKKVEFQHVYAHADDPGNEIADMLAGIATSKTNLGGGWHRSSANRERNRQRSKSNDPGFIRDNSLSVESRNSL